MSTSAMMRAARTVGGKIKTSLAVVGAAAAAGGYLQYKALFPDILKDDDGKKKVLVIPFHRIILMDHIERGFAGRLPGSTGEDESPIELETRDLVDLIHSAASDPSIVGLYGIFGHGSVLPAAGWADLEEVREALQVFKEAHRVHLEPNVLYAKDKTMVPFKEPKQLYAYADKFMMDSGSKEYYLASMFDHVHMQEKGQLDFMGMIASQLFIKDALHKYGVKLHIFKHGDYKNFANMFTETGYNKPHREAMSSILSALQTSVCNDITESRSKSLYSAWVKKNAKHQSNDLLWKRILQTGSFPAETALKAGFVDYLPQRDPLPDLLSYNNNRPSETETDKDEDKSISISSIATNFASFKAEKAIGLTTYKKMIDKKKRAEKKRKSLNKYFNDYPYFQKYMGPMTGQAEAVPSQDKIALVYVQGGIGDATARKTVNSLRKIAKDKDTKAVVLRVNSPGGSIFACETISQELQRLNIPVVVSFGNVAASGGYYISAKSDRIFASAKTLTGSIGVFGVRADLTGLAKQYGVSSDSIATGELAGMYSPMEPMTYKMRKLFETSIAQFYDQFKAVVGDGRGMDAKTVEKVAQGRVWTGEQAKLNGLVDELGSGLFRALAYAERNYTSGDAEIVAWPKKLSLLERIMEMSEDEDPLRLLGLIKSSVLALLQQSSAPSSQQSLDMAPIVRSLLLRLLSTASPTLSGIYMAADENTAVQCWVEQNTQSPIGQDELFGYFS